MKILKSKILSTIICSILAFCLFVPLAAALTGCGDSPTKPQPPSFDGMQIKNWDSYSAIGAGFETESTPTQRSATTFSSVQMSIIPQSKTFAESKSQKKSKLFGKTKDGKLEEISFVDKDNNSEDQTMNIKGFKSSSLLTFIQFTSEEVNTIGVPYYSFSENEDPIYVIDNATGNLYDITGKFYNLDIGTWSEDYNSESSAYLKGTQLEGNKYTFSFIYRFSFSESELIIEQCVNLSKVSSIYMVDRFDNIFFGVSHHGNASYLYSNGEIKKFSQYVYKAINSIVYLCTYEDTYALHKNDKTLRDDIKFVNKDGEIENAAPSPLIPAYLSSKYLIKQVGNTYYYFGLDDPWGSLYYDYNGIIKITKNSEFDCYAEDVILPEGSNSINVTNRILGNDRLYFLINSEVYYVDIETGKKTTLINNEYIINKMYSDNQGNIIYEGINKYQDDVIGMILPDDTITESVTRNNFEVYYLQPIN